jgi:thioredoxin 2
MASIIVTCSGCNTKNRIAASKQHMDPCCGKCKKQLGLKEVVQPVALGDKSMDNFIKSVQLPVLVDFFSPTCGPCTTLAPVLIDMTRQYLGKIIIATVDTSQNPGCAAHYHIRGVPTLVFFKKGKVIEEIVGLPEKSHLKAKLDYYSN